MGAPTETPWLTVKQAALYCQCGARVLYRAADSDQLRVARIGGRRDIRVKRDWLDAFLEATAKPVAVAR